MVKDKIIETPSLNPIWLQHADADRIVAIGKRLGISEAEVIQAALKLYEDALDAVNASLRRPTMFSMVLQEDQA